MQAFQGFLPFGSGDALGVLFERNLDVKTDPVDQRQNLFQPFRIRARRMQADGISHGFDLFHRIKQTVLPQRFPAAEYNPVQQLAPRFQKFDDFSPRHGRNAGKRL